MTALQYLRSIEWRCPVCLNGCFVCHGLIEHAPKCVLAAAIADAEELEKRRGLRTWVEVEAESNAIHPEEDWGYGYALRWVLGEE